jgi:hypothetical protein
MNDRDITLVLNGEEFDVKDFEIEHKVPEETDLRSGRSIQHGEIELTVETKPDE